MDIYYADTPDKLLRHLRGNGELILPKRYKSLEISGRSIKSFGKIKRIYVDVFVSRDTMLEDFGHLEFIGGELWIQYPSLYKPTLYSLGNIKIVSGDLAINEGVRDLGELIEIGGKAKFANGNLKSLGGLRKVGDGIILHKSLKGNISLDNVEVKGRIMFRKKSDMFINHEYVSSELCLNPNVVPWKTEMEVYNFTNALHNLKNKKEVREFYQTIFRPSFFEGKPIDTLGYSNYSRTLLFDIINKKKTFSSEVYHFHLKNLKKFYPSIRKDVFSLQLKDLIESNRYEEGFDLMLNERGLSFHKIKDWEYRLKRSLLNKRTLKSIVPKSFLTIIGWENYDKIVPIFQNLLREKIDFLNQKFSDKISASYISFFSLLYNQNVVPPALYSLDYYKILIQNTDVINSNLEVANNENEWYKSEVIIEEDSLIFKRTDKRSNDRDELVTIEEPYNTFFIREIGVQLLKELLFEAENLFRTKNGIYKIGEGGIWKSEGELFALIKSNFPEENIVQQASPYWLGKQRFDIYFPLRNITIEYQGEQHYRPIDFFGGDENFKKLQELDDLKKQLSLENGCHLFYVDEGYDLNTLINKLSVSISQSNLSQKSPKMNISKVPERRSSVVKIEADVQLYDCKDEKIITIQELKVVHPNAKPSYFIDRESLYGRYILESKKDESRTLAGWKSIKNTETGEILRFNKTGFAEFIGVKQNSVWAFFNGKQKKFQKKFIVVD